MAEKSNNVDAPDVGSWDRDQPAGKLVGASSILDIPQCTLPEDASKDKRSEVDVLWQVCWLVLHYRCRRKVVVELILGKRHWIKLQDAKLRCA